MESSQHLQWLLEGVAAWNTRRIHNPNIEPDFRNIDIRAAFEANGLCKPAQRLALNGIDFSNANMKSVRLQRCDLLNAKMDRARLGFADLSGANLLKASLRGAALRNAVVVGADLGETDLLASDLSRARLARAKLGNARMGYANLNHARLRGADLFSSDLRHADLRGADLRGADLRNAMIRSSNLDGADVRTVFLPHPSGSGTAVEVTDLSSTIGLVQAQLNEMRGDLGVILPTGLKHPEHWREPLPEKRPIVAQTGSEDNISVANVTRALEENRVPIALTGLSLLSQLSLLRDQILQSNDLAVNDSEAREQMLNFVDEMIVNTHEALDNVPTATQTVTEEEAEEFAGFVSRWFNSAKDGFNNILDPEKLGHSTAPAATVLGFGAFGYLISGFNVLGFGAGSLFGRWFVQDIKFGAASEKAEKLLEGSETNTD